MTIDPTRSSNIGPNAAEQAAEVSESRSHDRVEPAERRDQVEISDEARALAEAGTEDRIPVTEARLAEIQGRLDDGFYEQDAVVRQIAERLIDSGDL